MAASDGGSGIGSNEFPLFINRIVTNYLIRWHDIRKSDYVAIFVTDNRGALVVSSDSPSRVLLWQDLLVASGFQERHRGKSM